MTTKRTLEPNSLIDDRIYELKREFVLHSSLASITTNAISESKAKTFGEFIELYIPKHRNEKGYFAIQYQDDYHTTLVLNFYHFLRWMFCEYNHNYISFSNRITEATSITLDKNLKYRFGFSNTNFVLLFYNIQEEFRKYVNYAEFIDV